MDQIALSDCLKELSKMSKNYKFCSFFLEIPFVYFDTAIYRPDVSYKIHPS